MKPFIEVYQYNFIKMQVQNLINGYATANDEDVKHAVKSMAVERVLHLFPSMNEEQKLLLQPIETINGDKEKGEAYLTQLISYVVPFNITEQSIKKLFPKVKKLKAPALDKIDLRELSYLSWIDLNTNKKFIVTRKDNKLVGLQGSFQLANQKGICAICNHHEEVGLFLAKEKGNVQGTFTKRGNYICVDSEKCNQNITSLDKLHGLVERLTSR
ncbi:elongation factor G-binding protein [Ornithinibacillus sp. L9]|uniref:Elongation factor G-binding protein n=1 Tax=Ornithinibacillus caprae TaxID=2678566 RepID=A0A6N8FH85_9BACI|nr:FusB/FusC family EF-G-binding protein [Ornithinibacillus caprae]MUK88940.1 elongation factor G-binding protein [Ornithinibacillus caprae]